MASQTPAVVLLNPRARGGRGSQLWESIEPSLPAELETNVVLLDDAGDWSRQIQEASRGGVRAFIAAGGDGTVHALINALFQREPEEAVVARELVIGAVGLGSSNDFHKPLEFAADIPKKLSFDDPRKRDVGRVILRSGDEDTSVRYFLVSASLGATAEGNAYFNAGRGLVGKVKGRFPSLGIAGAVLRTIVTHEPGAATFHEGPPGIGECSLSNLNVLKVPYVSGTLHYDLPVGAADGLLTAGLWVDMGPFGLASTIASLARGRYVESPKKLQWQAPVIELELPKSGPVELDGELYEADRVRFEVLPAAVRECRPSP
jgi:diacylglycerol kinase family enzyme